MAIIMKTKTLKFMICFFMMAAQVNGQGSQSLKPVNTAYTYYVWMRESLYMSCFLYWVIDQKKIDESVIYCKSCNYHIGCFYTYGFFMGAADDQVLKKLKRLMYKGSKQSIVQFLLKLHVEKQTECPKCGQCGDWYALDQELKSA